MEKEIKVEVKHMTKKFGDLLVLNDISFNVMKGEFLCVVGPTGCGKTTFLNCLTNLYPLTSGEILVSGEPANLKKQNIAYIFQEPGENFLTGSFTGIRGLYSFFFLTMHHRR